MFLIDQPYVSDFLIETIKKNNYKIVSTKIAKKLINDDSLSWISEQSAINLLKEDRTIPLYTNSENALSWIIKNKVDSRLNSQVLLFKNKAIFRELIKTLFPDFFFRTVKLEDIPNLNPKKLKYPLVIKPTIGFFSIGVHIVKNEIDWDKAIKELNINTLKSIFPHEVLNTSDFILEEYIEGEEFAVDCYFNNKGEAVILNILHHKFSSGTDTSDRVYSTSKEIILKYKPEFEEFLNIIGKKTGLYNFPAHVELRINPSGKIIPIEINPLRFGGWCTTGDILGIALGFNSYSYYLNNLKPDWNQVFKNKTNKTFSIVVLNNNSGYNPEEISQFDYELLEQDFENPLIVRKLCIKEYPVFGFLFTETSQGYEEELEKILVSDLKKYILLK